MVCEFHALVRVESTHKLIGRMDPKPLHLFIEAFTAKPQHLCRLAAIALASAKSVFDAPSLKAIHQVAVARGSLFDCPHNILHRQYFTSDL